MFQIRDDNCYCIYKHTNTINGKIYIGMTCDFEERCGPHGVRYTSDKYSLFRRAIKKYGWDAFTHEILESGLTWDEANEREIFYIAKYKCNVVRYPELNAGYNLTDGGCGTKGNPLSEEAKAKLSARNSGPGNPRYGCTLSDETKAKISAANKGRFVGSKSPLYGKKQTPEHIAKAKANRPDQHGANNPKARSVICLDTGVIFPTIKDAAAWAGVSYMNIVHVCRHDQLTAGGYHWSYFDEADAEASA